MSFMVLYGFPRTIFGGSLMLVVGNLCYGMLGPVISGINV